MAATLQGGEAGVQIVVALFERVDALLELDMRESDHRPHVVELSLILDRVPVQFLLDVADPFRDLPNFPSQTLDLHVSLSNLALESPESAVDPVEPTVKLIEPTVDLVEPTVDLIEPTVNLMEPTVNLLEPNIDLIESAVGFCPRSLDPIRQVFQPGLNQSDEVFFFHRPDGTSERNPRESGVTAPTRSSATVP